MDRSRKEERASLAIKKLDDAIREIQKQAERDIQELRRAKEAILKLPSQTQDLMGVRLSDAITTVLNSAGGRMPFSALLEELLGRGARLGVPEKPQRFTANLKTAVINGPRFRYDKVTDSVSLIKRKERNQ